MAKRKPASVRVILAEEFMQPMGLTQAALATAMVVQRKHVNELCNGRRGVTAATALILARVFGNSPEFWLNMQRRRVFIPKPVAIPVFTGTCFWETPLRLLCPGQHSKEPPAS